ncbi:hypothetical protein [Spirosoma flavum]|uniref:Uncharacterized protein n=1 Tax=Spirosoma flavum TaxID=2048557 RepID=A0ABW6ANP3_9BACT
MLTICLRVSLWVSWVETREAVRLNQDDVVRLTASRDKGPHSLVLTPTGLAS